MVLCSSRCLTNSVRNASVVWVLNLSCSHVTRVPSLARTAPIMPTLSRTGACLITGSFSSGGNHAASREPCCWKWHSSMNHISTCLLPARPSSFFICLLGLHVRLGNHWAGFSPAKAQLMKEILALPNLQFNIELFLQVMTQEFTVPQVLRIPEFPREAAQVLRQNGLVPRQKPGIPSNSSGITQAIDARFIITLNPVLNCSRAIAKKRNNICACPSITNEQYAMKPMLEPGFICAMDFIFDDCSRFLWIANGNSSHNRPPFGVYYRPYQ